MKKIGFWMVAAWASVVWCGELAAFDLGEVRVNGFVSQGYLESSGNNFLADSKGGTTQINEAGLAVTSRVNDRLRIGLQFLSRDLGVEGDNEVLLDWGLADYRHRDWLGLRVGKVKLPIGLYNEGRDSDFLRPMAFLPQGIYDENKRNLLVAVQGGAVYGNVGAGPLGDFDYQFYYGELNFPDDSGQSRGLNMQATGLAKKMGLGVVTKFSADNDYAYGGSIIYNTPLEGLRLGASQFEGKTNFDIKLLNMATGAASSAMGQGRNKDFVVYSLEYAMPSLTAAFEYTEYSAQVEMFGKPLPGGRSQGGYGLLTWRFVDQVALSVLYDVHYADKHDHDGGNFVKQGKPDFMGWRKDFGVGLRYDVNDNWLVKVEWHDVDGAALGLSVVNPEGLEENWSYFIAKMSFNF